MKNKIKKFNFLDFYKFKDCHKPKFCKVGNKEVYICGYSHLDKHSEEIINKLDLFIGLDDIWLKHLSQPLNNNFIVRWFQSLLPKITINNLVVYHIPDYDIDLPLFHCVYSAFLKYDIGFGCIGGHGRSGWLLAKLIQKVEKLQGENLKNAINKRLCTEAIESMIQHKDLNIQYKKSDMVKLFRFSQLDIKKTKHDKDCPECNGTGFNYGYACLYCDGKGII